MSLELRLVELQRDLFNALAELAEHRQREADERGALMFVFVFGAFVGALTMLTLQWWWP